MGRRAGILLLGAGLIFAADRWQLRAVDAELVHELPNADSFLPADVEVQVWQDDILHASASFFTPDSLASLSHTIVVPPGDYQVDYAVVTRFGEAGLRFTAPLTVEEPGRYYLRYELDGD
jgi:hypothetical protein